MAELTVEVRSRVVGESPEAPDLAPISLRLLDERLSVAELIRRTVAEQVRELTVRRRLDAEQAGRALARHYLSAEEVAAQARRGAVRFPTARTGKPAQLDPALEVEKALRAFEAGTYVILVDGRRVERLDEVVPFSPGTKVTFLRLLPLVGG